MAREVRWRRGNATETASFIGALAEVTVNTDHKSLHVHDSITSGGFETARVDLTNVDNATFAAKATAAGVAGGGGGGGTGGADANASYITVNSESGLANERRLQAGNGLSGSDGGAGGAFSLAVTYANVAPSNLGSAAIGSSNLVARADHVHAMPTASQVGAVPTTRTVTAGTALSGGGALSSNITLNLNATLSDLHDAFVLSPQNGDILVYNSATSRFENNAYSGLPTLTVKYNSTTIANSVNTVNFIGNSITVATGGGGLVNVTVPTIYSSTQILDMVGGMVSGGAIKNGIAVTYNSVSEKLNFDVNDFTLTLSGVIQGVATVTDLASATLSTTVTPNGIKLGQDTNGNFVQSVAAASTSNGIVVSGTGANAVVTITLNPLDSNFIESVQDIMGTMVTSNVENGISVTYDDPGGKINFDVNDPIITLAGAVAGSATMTNLSNTTITVTQQPGSVTLGGHTTGNYVASVAAASGANGIVVTGTGAGAAVTVGLNMGDSNFIEGVQDAFSLLLANGTQSGISVTYNDPANGINFDVNDPIITISGAVAGFATMTNLGNTTISVSQQNDSVTLGAHTTGNYVATVAPSAGANGIVITGSGSESAAVQVGLNMADPFFIEGVQDAFSLLLANGTQSGISVTYNDAANGLNFDVNDPVIAIQGSVAGSATMTNLGNVAITVAQQADSVTLGTHTTGNYVATVAAGANGITIAGSGSETAAVTVDLNFQNANLIEGVQDIIGAMITAGVATGPISLTYNDAQNRLDYALGNATITLSGAVTGAATMVNHTSATITTTIGAGAVILGTNTTGNFVQTVASAPNSNGVVISGSGSANAQVTVDVNMANANFIEGIQDIVGAMAVAGTQTGITVTYNDPAGTLNFVVNSTGLDADTLDGLDSTVFLRKDIAQTVTNQVTFSSPLANIAVSSASLSSIPLVVANAISNQAAAMAFNRPGTYTVYFGLDVDNQLKVGGASMGNVAYKVWHEGSDGIGSGLDADLVRGLVPTTTPGASSVPLRDSNGAVQSSNFIANSTTPIYHIYQTDGATDTKRTYIRNISNSTRISFVNDNQSVVTDWMTVTRSGTTANTVAFSLTGNITVNGSGVYHSGNFNPSNYMPTAGGTFSGPVSFSSASGNYVLWPAANLGAPSFTSRSAGVRAVYYQQLGSTSGDYATGVDTNTFWMSVPTTAESFKFYGGTTVAATLTGRGALTVANTVTLAAGTTTVVPLQLQAGTLAATPIPHAMEWDGNYLYMTNSGGTRAKVGTNVTSDDLELLDMMNW